MASHDVPTVTINRNGSPVNINESDFNPAEHTKWGEEEAPPEDIDETDTSEIDETNTDETGDDAVTEQPAVQMPPPPVTHANPRVAMKIGSRFFICDSITQAKIVADNINPKGYATEDEAKAAAGIK